MRDILKLAEEFERKAGNYGLTLLAEEFEKLAAAKKPKVAKFKDGIVICGEFGSPEVAKILKPYEGKLPLVVSDPPYGVLPSSVSWDQGITDDDYIRWTDDCAKYMANGASLYMYGGIGKPHDRIFFRYLARVEEDTPLVMRNLITWAKRRGYGKKNDWLFTREECAWLIKGNNGKPRTFNIVPGGGLTSELRGYKGFNKLYPAKSEFKRRTNIWRVPELLKGKSHVCEKPTELAEIMITTHTKKGDTVLDPFAGSGSSGSAARNLGRKFILIERDPGNFKIIVDRLSKP
jgi:DNA modification methylase